MTIKDATTMLLVYQGKTKTDIENIIKVLDAQENIEQEPPKSIRFVNDTKALGRIRGVSYSSEQNVAGTSIDCYEYNVRAEDAYRLALFSETFDEDYAIRLFTEDAPFSRFKSNSKVHVLSEITYKTACILKYQAGVSEVVRYAILAPKDMTFDMNEFVISVEKSSAAASTAFFSK